MLTVLGIPKASDETIIGSGVEYVEHAIDPHWLSDEEITQRIKPSFSAPNVVIYLQKSRGYSSERRSLSNAEIGRLMESAKKSIPTQSLLSITAMVNSWKQTSRLIAVPT